MKRLFLTILLFVSLLSLSGCGSGGRDQTIPDDSGHSGALTLPQGGQSDGGYPAERPSAGESVAFDGAQDTASAAERRAIWISYLELQDLLTANEEESRKNMERVFDDVATMGLNTVIVQVRPFADAIYPSEYFPWSHIITGTQGQDPGYDPLGMMVPLAKERGLRFEAWINPYRVKSTVTPLAETSPIYHWLKEKEDYVLTTAGGSGTEVLSQALYLNPAREECQSLIVNGVKELVENYPIDAVHFDDYFYPTTDTAFDQKAFSESGKEKSLDDWRRENVNTLIQLVYDEIQSVNGQVEFGISPQGNLDINYNRQFADVSRWIQEGYLDYIMPQIYYGFKNNLAFDKTLKQWCDLSKESPVRLYPGLAAYKIGKEDAWAGETGAQEWITDGGDILKRQVEEIRSLEDGCKGFSLYSYNSLFRPEESIKELVEEERKNLKSILN